MGLLRSCYRDLSECSRPCVNFQQHIDLKDVRGFKRRIPNLCQRRSVDPLTLQLSRSSPCSNPSSVPWTQAYPGGRLYCDDVMPPVDWSVHGDRVVCRFVCLRNNIPSCFPNVIRKYRIHLLCRGLCRLWHGNCP